jgi:uncharacterized repeat protein (TIGR01451 family)
VALDSAGNLYIADQSNQIRKVNSSGIITHFAGTGASGFSGDLGPAISAALSIPTGVAVDQAGNLYISDSFNLRVRKVNTNGIITTFAGGNSNVPLGDNGPATSAHLYGPVGVSTDAAGNVYIADKNSRVRKVDANGNITTAAGTGSAPFGGDSGPAGLAQFFGVWGIGRDKAGSLFVSDFGNDRLRKITTLGTISTYAGTGTCCDALGSGAATGTRIIVYAVSVDSSGNVYFGDDSAVAKVALNGTISAEAGNGIPGFSGDGGLALNASVPKAIPGLAVDSTGNVYLADPSTFRIRKVTLDGNINTVVNLSGQFGSGGDGGPGTAAQLAYPAGLAVDTAGNLYIADAFNNRVRKLTIADGTISTVAGNGSAGNSGDGGPATSASMSNPRGVAVDAAGNLYIANDGNTIRVVSGGIINTIAGTGVAGYSGDGGPATLAQLSNPYSLVTDGIGNVYVTDYANSAVRVLQPAGTEPVFAVSMTHTGDFTAGQTGATYTITLSNAAQAASSNGVVTVTDIVPSGLTLVIMSGSGWTCPSNFCTRSDALAPGGNYPITVTVNVAASAPPQVTNRVAVTGAGSLGAVSTDPTLIGSATPVLEIASTHPSPFAFGQTNAVYTIYVGNVVGARATSGLVTVTETLPTGFSLGSMTGNGWTCPNNTCTRNDALSGGNLYPAILVSAGLPSSGSSPVTNKVSVSGGGSAPATANDVTTIQCTGSGAVSVQAIINQALGVSAASSDLNGDRVVNVVDVQIEITAVLALGCVL